MKNYSIIISIFLLFGCKTEVVVTDFKPPFGETVAVYSVSDTEAEVNVDLTNVRGIVTETGAVWSAKPSPTVADNRQSITGLKIDQTVLIKIDKLQKGKTYFVKAYVANGKDIIYGAELTLVHNFTNEWKKLDSPELSSNEYISADGAYFDNIITGGITFNKINRLNNIAVYKQYYPNFGQWDLRFSDRREIPFQMRYNQIHSPFNVGVPAILIGAGHYKGSKGERIYLNDLKVRGVDGYKWDPIYPGVEAETSSFGVGKYAYALENIAKGKLWRFEFTTTVVWTEMPAIPYSKAAKYLSIADEKNAYVVVEPELLDDLAIEVYQFSPDANKWKKMADFPGNNRRRGSIFKIKNRLFYGLGQSIKTQAGLRDIWEFLPETNTWLKTTDYPGGGTINVAAVEYFGGVYMGFGQQVVPSITKAENIKQMADFWIYRPK
jgi:hypothetical protein